MFEPTSLTERRRDGRFSIAGTARVGFAWDLWKVVVPGRLLDVSTTGMAVALPHNGSTDQLLGLLDAASLANLQLDPADGDWPGAFVRGHLVRSQTSPQEILAAFHIPTVNDDYAAIVDLLRWGGTSEHPNLRHTDA